MAFGDTLNIKPGKSGVIPSGFGSSFGAKIDLQTTAGLKAKAKQVGLEEKAEKITDIGEDPEKIFSGGFISDVFDTLNALQHGVTGVLKGKSFAEGVRTRQSFTQKDALGDFGIPGFIVGLGLDIAVDPLTYISPLSVARKIPGLVKGVNALKGSTKQTRLGQVLGRKFVYRFGQDPIYIRLAERSIKATQVGVRNALDLARPITKLDPNIQRLIASARKAGTLDNLSADILEKAQPAFKELDRLGKEAVDQGLLSAETYNKNVGTYMARLYSSKEAPADTINKVQTFFDKRPQRIDITRFMKRKDIAEDVREAMGEILEAGYPTAKALVQLTASVEKAKFFKIVNDNWAKDAIEEGFEKLPDTKRLGALAGKFVPKPILDDIQELIRPKKVGSLNKLVGTFKYSKVVLNPATHARNIMSNFLLNNFEGLSPARVDIYAKAAKEIVKKGPLYREAQEQGLGLNTFAASELKNMLLDSSVTKQGKAIRDGLEKISDLYQAEEEFAKMAQYTYQKSLGKTPEEAWEVAERATFNYAQVTPFIRQMREAIWGMPFITFTYKATPQVLKTIAKKPTKISNIGKIKNAIENATDVEIRKEERAVEPGYIKDGFYIRIPGEDKFGRARYFDMTYILPFGDLVSGKLFESRQAGEPFPRKIIREFAFMNAVLELGSNKDFFGNPIIKLDSIDLDDQAFDVMKYLVKFIGPPAVADFPARIKRSLDFQKSAKELPFEVEQRTTRTVSQEVLRQFGGLKLTPISIKRERDKREREMRKRLEDLLIGAGILRKFERVFIPKD